jgi:hypothetical protein
MLLCLSPCLELFMPLLYAWPYVLQRLDIGAYHRSRSTQCFAVLGLIPLRVIREVFEDKVRVPVQQ